MSRNTFRYAAAAGLAAAFLFSLIPAAEARDPANVFKGQIVTAKKPLPTKAKSKQAFVKKVRKLKAIKFWEDKENERWKIHYAAFFRRPLNDLEVTVKLYDVTDGRKHMITSFQQYLNRRGERVLNSSVVLERKYFGVNKRILMVMENRGKALASAKFSILGEGPKYTGEVDFTGDD